MKSATASMLSSLMLGEKTSMCISASIRHALTLHGSTVSENSDGISMAIVGSCPQNQKSSFLLQVHGQGKIAIYGKGLQHRGKCTGLSLSTKFDQ